jgi:hypothetical protein
MAKVIQFCASDTDMFVLDEDGAAYGARVDTTRWVNLAPEHTAGSAPWTGRRGEQAVTGAQRRSARGGKLAEGRRT